MKEEVEEYIKNIYYDFNRVGALSTSENLFEAIKSEGNKYNLTLDDVEEYLKSNELYTVFKKLPHKIKKYPKMVAKTLDSLWFTDLAHYPQFAKFNKVNGKEMSFLLICVDCFSRMTFVSKLETASAKDLINGFKDIFAKSKRKPLMLIADRGSNYTSKLFKQFLHREGIKLSLLNPPSKASMAERRIQVIGDRLYKLFYLYQDRNWVGRIDGIVNTLNRTYHRGLRGYPYKVNKDNAESYFIKQYLPDEKLTAKEKKTENKLLPYEFSIGDNVRIVAERSQFKKSYREKYTIEYFVVSKRYYRNIYPIYQISDILSNPIEGTFRTEELEKIIVKDDNVYKIEEILSSKRMLNKETKKREKFVLVKWYVYSMQSLSVFVFAILFLIWHFIISSFVFLGTGGVVYSIVIYLKVR